MEPSFGRFADIFLDDECYSSIEPFIHVTEEQQSELLGWNEFDDVSSDEDDDLNIFITPKRKNEFQQYDSLSPESKKLLKKCRESHILYEIDSALKKYVDSEKDCSLEFSFSDSFRRMLLHSVCEYYNLSSRSKDREEGRVTIVKKTDDLYRSTLHLTSVIEAIYM
eukprot:TRINITY_DN798_c0_g1_i1.p1 TRINITY_DN798_c0_g1~~TRINITY_DN798_c0_g1_i1.p1  ORF type:complete len:166 (+),score=39.04 TRINITY_DN798_c0_g1_i1:470-967(+)